MRNRLLLASAVALTALVAPVSHAAPATPLHWVGAWQASPESGGAASTDKSFRMPVHASIGGSVLRLRLSNAYGKAPVTIANLTLALPLSGQPGPAIDPATVKVVAKRIVVPAGKDVYTRAVSYPVPADGWITVSFSAPGSFPATTHHNVGMTTTWKTLDGMGDQTGDTAGTTFVTPGIDYTYLSALDVVGPKQLRTVVALGDSITDCCYSAPDTNKRWTDLLNERLAAAPGPRRFVVTNSAMSGNDVSNDRDGNQDQGAAGVTRITRDVFDEPNVSTVIVFEGINDVGTGVPASTAISAYQRIVTESHRRGIRVVFATLTPCKQAFAAGGSYVADAPVRDQLNAWLRAHRSSFDGLIEFDRAVASPLDPDAWSPQYFFDGLHPNPLGLNAMAGAVPLSVLG
ncbi:MAG: putative secreted protein [Frankiales bacterium]|nr:putative secreted protein [Frankiales bacterium]